MFQSCLLVSISLLVTKSATVMDCDGEEAVRDFFREIKLDYCGDIAVDNGYDNLWDLKEISQGDLAELGIEKQGHVKRILRTLRDVDCTDIEGSVISAAVVYGAGNEPAPGEITPWTPDSAVIEFLSENALFDLFSCHEIFVIDAYYPTIDKFRAIYRGLVTRLQCRSRSRDIVYDRMMKYASGSDTHALIHANYEYCRQIYIDILLDIDEIQAQIAELNDTAKSLCQVSLVGVNILTNGRIQ